MVIFKLENKNIYIYITLISLNGKAYIDIYNIQVDISSKLIREQGWNPYMYILV